jgi:hypothetical protein
MGGGLPSLIKLEPSPLGGAASPWLSAGMSATPGLTAAPFGVSPTGVPPTVMLLPPDLGAGSWTLLSPEGVFKGAERWYWADWHAGYRAGDYPSRSHQVGQSVVRYEGDHQATVEEIVERYDPGWGTRNLADIRAVVAKSGARPYARPGAGAPLRHSIVQREFVGDESLLIEQKPWSFDGSTTIPPSDIQLIAVVRVGDLVATVVPTIGTKPEVARTLALAAVVRLR